STTLFRSTVNSLIEWYRPSRTLGADELADAVSTMIFEGLRTETHAHSPFGRFTPICNCVLTFVRARCQSNYRTNGRLVKEWVCYDRGAGKLCDREVGRPRRRRGPVD